MLRVTCPCGAPYSLGDHLAGRSFKCPKCGRVLQVGAQGAGGQPQTHPSGWGQAQQGRPSGVGAQRPSGRQPQQRPSGRQQPPKRPSNAGNELALVDDDDDGLLNSMDQSKEQQAPSPQALKRSSSGRQRAMRTSGSGRVSKTTSGRRARKASSSGNRRAAEPEYTAGGPDSGHARQCPVCDATIARQAPECPSCGVVLKGPSALQKLQNSFDFSKLSKVAVYAAVVGAVAYGVKVWRGDPKPVRPTPTPRRTETPTPTATVTETPEATPTPTDTGPKVEVDPNFMIPAEGPLRKLFLALRDAEGLRDLRDAMAALQAAKDALGALDTALQSKNQQFRQRVHRVRLRAGDEQDQHEYIDRALQSRVPLDLLFSVVAALDLDAVLYEDKIEKLRGRRDAGLAGEYATLAQTGKAPRVLTPARLALEKEQDPEARQLLGTIVVHGRDGSALEDVVDALDSSSPTVKRVALEALQELAGDLGPGGDEVAVWREWGRRYQPVRKLLGQACGEVASPGREETRASCEAIKRLCEDPERVFEFVPVFFRDLASERTETGHVLAQVVARRGREFPEQTKKLVGELNASDVHLREAQWVVQGALLALESDALEVTLEAYQRKALPVDSVYVPSFIDPPAERDLKPLAEFLWQEDAAGAQALSKFRVLDDRMEDFILRSGSSARRHVGGLISHPKIGAELIDLMQKGGYDEHVPSISVAAGMLSDWGTHDVVRDLIRLINDDPPVVEAMAPFGAIAKPEDVSKLSRLAKDEELNPNAARVLFRAIVQAGTLRDVERALGPRAKREDRVQPAAKEFLTYAGSEIVGKEIFAPIEAFLEASEEDIKAGKVQGPDEKRLRAVGFCCDPKVNRKLWQYTNRGLAQAGTVPVRHLYLLFAVHGRLGYDEQVAVEMADYLNATNRYRGSIARALSLMFVDPGRGSDAVKQKVVQSLVDYLGGQKLRYDAEDLSALASLATLDKDATVKVMPRFLEQLQGTMINADSYAYMAFSLALAEMHDELDAFAFSPKDEFRAGVAAGLLYAALANPQLKIPRTLQILRYDRDRIVRGLAGAALGFLKQEGLEHDLAAALAWEDKWLKTAVGPGGLAQIVTLHKYTASRRRLLWIAASSALGLSDRQQPHYHDNIGHARRLEIDRELRAQLRDKSR